MPEDIFTLVTVIMRAKADTSYAEELARPNIISETNKRRTIKNLLEAATRNIESALEIACAERDI